MEKPWVGKEASKSLMKELYSLQSDFVYCEKAVTELPQLQRCPQRAVPRWAGVGVQLLVLQVQEQEQLRWGQGCCQAGMSCPGLPMDLCALSIAHPTLQAVQGSQESHTAMEQLSASSLTRLYPPLRYRGFFAPSLCCQVCISGHI